MPASSREFCAVAVLAADILADNARIIQAGQFRTTSSGGGSVATNLDDLTDVTITSVQDDDVLIYDTATSQWLNTPLAHIGVRSVNGLTGAVTGIAITGSNTFTGLQTMTAGITASHLWVTNGATFAARSSFINGLSADTIWATNGVTFNSNLYAGTIRGGLLNVQNTGNNLLGDVTGVLGGGYIQVDNSSGVAVNKIVGTLYTDAIRAGAAVSVTGSISSSTQILATGRMSNAGMTSTGVVTLTGSLTANNLYVTNGVTFASTSVHNNLATFNAGITAGTITGLTGVYGTAGITFASKIGLLANTIALRDGANDINIKPGSGVLDIGLGEGGVAGTSTSVRLLDGNSAFTSTIHMR